MKQEAINQLDAVPVSGPDSTVALGGNSSVAGAPSETSRVVAPSNDPRMRAYVDG